MLPLIPFAAGLLAGAAAIRLFRSDKARTGLNKARASLGKAEDQLREVAVSGLTAVESSSARLRERLSTTADAPPAEIVEAVVMEVETVTAAKAKATPRKKAAVPRKRTPKAATAHPDKEQAS